MWMPLVEKSAVFLTEPSGLDMAVRVIEFGQSALPSFNLPEPGRERCLVAQTANYVRLSSFEDVPGLAMRPMIVLITSGHITQEVQGRLSGSQDTRQA